NGSKLNPRLREMAIIQVGYVTRSVYEYTHHVQIGLEAGVSAADILAIAADTAGKQTHLDALARAALKAARDLTRDITPSDESFRHRRAGKLGRNALQSRDSARCAEQKLVGDPR